MRIDITHKTVRKGFILKTSYYAVCLSVHFDHEELHIIRQRQLMKTILLERRPATARVDDRDDRFTLRVGDIVNGKTDRFLCATPADAKFYELELLQALEQLKSWIGLNAETEERRVVEL